MPNNFDDSCVSLFVRQARNNCWSNLRLFEACTRLPANQYFAERKSFFGSIHATLEHILNVDELYLARLENESPNSADFDESFETLQALRTRQQAADRQLLAFCEGRSAPSLAAEVSFARLDGQRYTERVADVLMHVFVHQTHHRGQVHGMLSQTDVAPPQLDEFFMHGDLQLRQDELAQLSLPVE